MFNKLIFFTGIQTKNVWQEIPMDNRWNVPGTMVGTQRAQFFLHALGAVTGHGRTHRDRRPASQ